MNVSPLTIVLVGPTNVGKSTLFNRLTRTRAAIVCDRPGVTIDRHEMLVRETPAGISLRVIDTGGVGPSLDEHPLGPEIERAAREAVEQADLILFVVDGTREVGLEEFEVARWLRRQNRIDDKPVWVLANKSDSGRFDASSYHALGFGEQWEVSAEHGRGFEELWTAIETRFAHAAQVPNELSDSSESSPEKAPRIIVLGRPNVGKSTLLNAVLGEERHVVSQMPGTTRDVIESQYHRHGLNWRLCDTAGMRRPGRLEPDVERVARYKLEDAARTADLAILVIDSSEGVTDLDAAIGGMAMDFGLSLVIALNKSDRLQGEKERDLSWNLQRTQDLKLEFLKWCPRVAISALTGKGVSQLVKTAEKVLQSRKTRAQTSKLNQLFEKKWRHHPHPMAGGKSPKFYYLSQVETSPPQFVLFANIPGSAIHFSYKRYLMNSLRESFDFEGTPIRLHFKTARGSTGRA